MGHYVDDERYDEHGSYRGYTRRWESDIGCFVATTVYGNKDAPQVQTLRKFRDNILLKNEFDRIFVNLYYNNCGKKVAALIKNNPSLIPEIRKSLDFLVENYNKWEEKNEKPVNKTR